MSNNQNETNTEYDKQNDDVFARIANITSSTRIVTERFNRVSNGNKFKIDTDDNAVVDTGTDNNNNITYLDSIFEHLTKKQIKQDVVWRLYQYLKKEEYETESIDLDLRITLDGKSVGNISRYMVLDMQCIDAVASIFNQSRGSIFGTFSIGIAFDYYHDDEILYVTPKYETFKEEILNYQQINLHQYSYEILVKANEYHSTDLVKSIECNRYSIPAGYGISKEDVISVDRLASIILYTDYSNLSSQFTSTFRKSNTFEPIQATIQRHRHYYWLGRFRNRSIISNIHFMSNCCGYEI